MGLGNWTSTSGSGISSAITKSNARLVPA